MAVREGLVLHCSVILPNEAPTPNFSLKWLNRQNCSMSLSTRLLKSIQSISSLYIKDWNEVVRMKGEMMNRHQNNRQQMSLKHNLHLNSNMDDEQSSKASSVTIGLGLFRPLYKMNGLETAAHCWYTRLHEPFIIVKSATLNQCWAASVQGCWS